MLINQMEMDDLEASRPNSAGMDPQLLQPALAGIQESVARSRRPVYVRGRAHNKSEGTSLGRAVVNALPRRNVSFKFTEWRDAAVEQAVQHLQSAFDQLASDSADRQNTAEQVNNVLLSTACPRLLSLTSHIALNVLLSTFVFVLSHVYLCRRQRKLHVSTRTRGRRSKMCLTS